LSLSGFVILICFSHAAKIISGAASDTPLKKRILLQPAQMATEVLAVQILPKF